MEKLFMQKTKIMLLIIFIVSFFVGCSTTGSITNDTKKSKDIKMVSVLNFKCTDPVIANNIRNTVIDSLLTHYSVVIGNEADVVINGTIILSSDQVANTSAGSSVDYISEISAQIINNNKVLDSATVSQVRTNSSTPDPTEVMGRKIGEKIKNVLSQIHSLNP